MSKYLREGIWFCIPIVLAIAACGIWFKTIFSPNPYINLSDGVSLSVNIYCFIAAITIISGLIISLISNLYTRFRSIIKATVLLLYTSLLLLIITYIIQLNKMLAPQEGWLIYPPLSALKDKIEVKESYFFCNPIYLFLFQLSLIILAVFTAYRIGSRDFNQKGTAGS
jgi:hypothetical protein